MNDPGIAHTNQSQIDSRANLFFLLRTLAIQAQERFNVLKSSSYCSITEEQVQESVRRNGLL
jgi:hypothetical protein